eukprot:gene28733-31910_t
MVKWDITFLLTLFYKGWHRAAGQLPPTMKSRYWSFPQMVAHHTIGGCNLCPGDMLGSGTISGDGARERGCLLEATWAGMDPLSMESVPMSEGGPPTALDSSDFERTYLEDGDTVAMSGTCTAEGGNITSIGRIGKLATNSSALFVCDVQDRFRPVIHHFPSVVDTARRMIQASTTLGLPIIVTEQYPKALGVTCSELTEVLPPTAKTYQKTMFSVLPPTAKTYQKTMFSMMIPEVEEQLKQMPEVKQILLLGIETHVCVQQTALDLLEKGFEVHVLVDGVSSQRAHDRAVGIQRMAQSGAFLTTSESVMFQLVQNAKHKDFKAISALVKEPRAEPIPFMPSL